LLEPLHADQCDCTNKTVNCASDYRVLLGAFMLRLPVFFPPPLAFQAESPYSRLILSCLLRTDAVCSTTLHCLCWFTRDLLAVVDSDK